MPTTRTTPGQGVTGDRKVLGVAVKTTPRATKMADAATRRAILVLLSGIYILSIVGSIFFVG